MQESRTEVFTVLWPLMEEMNVDSPSSNSNSNNSTNSNSNSGDNDGQFIDYAYDKVLKEKIGRINELITSSDRDRNQIEALKKLINSMLKDIPLKKRSRYMDEYNGIIGQGISFIVFYLCVSEYF